LQRSFCGIVGNLKADRKGYWVEWGIDNTGFLLILAAVKAPNYRLTTRTGDKPYLAFFDLKDIFSHFKKRKICL
jgi:hypothetical protein